VVEPRSEDTYALPADEHDGLAARTLDVECFAAAPALMLGEGMAADFR
jgi:hypothetical protein